MKLDPVVEVEELGSSGRRHAVQRPMVFLGRAPQNDVVLADPCVSGQHLVVWVEADGLWVRDLGSANGTWIDEVRLREPQRLRPGAVLRLGPYLQVGVRLADAPAASSESTLVAIQHGAGLRLPVVRGRLVFGSSPDCDVVIDGAEPWAATIRVYPGPEIWLGAGSTDRAIEVGATFAVGAFDFAVVQVPHQVADTVVPSLARYPYRLVAKRGPRGVAAQLLPMGDGAAYRPTDAGMARLLYHLGRAVESDRAAGRAGMEEGWCDEREVAQAVFGEQNTQERVLRLVEDLRAELNAVGFPPWMVERRTGGLRLCVSEVSCADAGRS